MWTNCETNPTAGVLASRELARPRFLTKLPPYLVANWAASTLPPKPSTTEVTRVAAACWVLFACSAMTETVTALPASIPALRARGIRMPALISERPTALSSEPRLGYATTASPEA